MFGFSLPRPRRFEYTFTPKHGSWLNLVEGFFSKFARSVLRHIDRRFQNSNHTGLSEFQHLAAQTGEDELSGFMESVAVSDLLTHAPTSTRRKRYAAPLPRQSTLRAPNGLHPRTRRSDQPGIARSMESVV
jgi:hypothetical protein